MKRKQAYYVTVIFEKHHLVRVEATSREAARAAASELVQCARTIMPDFVSVHDKTVIGNAVCIGTAEATKERK